MYPTLLLELGVIHVPIRGSLQFLSAFFYCVRVLNIVVEHMEIIRMVYTNGRITCSL